MPARKRLSLKEKANILEKSLKPNFDKENGIGKTCLYKTLKEKDNILSMNLKKSNVNSRKSAKSLLS